MRLGTGFLAISLVLGGCCKTRFVTVPIKISEACMGDLGPPPPVPDLETLDKALMVSYLEDLVPWARRAWARCGEGPPSDR